MCRAPFAGKNTQHLILFSPRKHEEELICKQLESTPIRPGRSIDVHLKVLLLKRSWQRARFVDGLKSFLKTIKVYFEPNRNILHLTWLVIYRYETNILAESKTNKFLSIIQVWTDWINTNKIRGWLRCFKFLIYFKYLKYLKRIVINLAVFVKAFNYSEQGLD